MRDGGFQRGGGDVVVEEMLLESLAHSSKGLLFWEPVAGSTMGLSESSTPWLRGSDHGLWGVILQTLFYAYSTTVPYFDRGTATIPRDRRLSTSLPSSIAEFSTSRTLQVPATTALRCRYGISHCYVIFSTC